MTTANLPAEIEKLANKWEEESVSLMRSGDTQTWVRGDAYRNRAAELRALLPAGVSVKGRTPRICCSTDDGFCIIVTSEPFAKLSRRGEWWATDEYAFTGNRAECEAFLAQHRDPEPAPANAAAQAVEGVELPNAWGHWKRGDKHYWVFGRKPWAQPIDEGGLPSGDVDMVEVKDLPIGNWQPWHPATALTRQLAEAQAEVGKWKAARDGCESQYQAKVEELGVEISSRIAAEQSRDTLQARVEELTDLAETAWGLIANAQGGDWSLAMTGWAEAASKWRDRYHAMLDRLPASPSTSHDVRLPAIKAKLLEAAAMCDVNPEAKGA